MTKFNKGDRFRVIENGNLGTIEDVSYNSMTVDWEYYVKWDSFIYTSCYQSSEVDDKWEKISSTQLVAGSGTLSVNGAVIGETADFHITMDTPRYCNHQWKTYQGFTDHYEYCSKCDEKRET